MKKLLLFAVIGLCAAFSPLARAQEAPPRPFSAQYVFDPLDKGKPTQVLSYVANTFHDVANKPGFDLDLRALLGVQDNLRVGTALTWTYHLSFTAAKEIRPKLDLSIGPWINYGLGDSKLRGGLYVGIGGSF